MHGKTGGNVLKGSIHNRSSTEFDFLHDSVHIHTIGNADSVTVVCLPRNEPSPDAMTRGVSSGSDSGATLCGSRSLGSIITQYESSAGNRDRG